MTHLDCCARCPFKLRPSAARSPSPPAHWFWGETRTQTHTPQLASVHKALRYELHLIQWLPAANASRHKFTAYFCKE
jgi:hypothetical protein